MGSPPAPIPWVEDSEHDAVRIFVNIEIYSLEALFRACYLFTDRCYVFIEPDRSSSTVRVNFARKNGDTDLGRIVGDFSNELINQKLRRDIAAETRPIRELIVAQAFAEADLLDRSASESDYNDDPKDIAK